jgi:hypothetical protein
VAHVSILVMLVSVRGIPVTSIPEDNGTNRKAPVRFVFFSIRRTSATGNLDTILYIQASPETFVNLFLAVFEHLFLV